LGNVLCHAMYGYGQEPPTSTPLTPKPKEPSKPLVAQYKRGAHFLHKDGSHWGAPRHIKSDRLAVSVVPVSAQAEVKGGCAVQVVVRCQPWAAGRRPRPASRPTSGSGRTTSSATRNACRSWGSRREHGSPKHLPVALRLSSGRSRLLCSRYDVRWTALLGRLNRFPEALRAGGAESRGGRASYKNGKAQPRGAAMCRDTPVGNDPRGPGPVATDSASILTVSGEATPLAS